MSKPPPSDPAASTIETALALEAEREVSGTTSTSDAAVAEARAILHTWVDTVTAAAAVPGAGRVMLVHANGRSSAIASSQLAYQMSPAVKFGPGA